MKKLLFIPLLLFFCFSITQAQEVFLGKTQGVVMNSLSKINYRNFEGQVITGEHYIMNFKFDEWRDTAFVKKLDSSKYGILPTPRYTIYSFEFDQSICISYKIYYHNPSDYQKVIGDLNSHYQNQTNNIWVDNSRQIEVILTKQNKEDDFNVDFHKLKK